MPQGRRGGYDEGPRAGKMDLVVARTANCARYTASAVLVIAPSSGASTSARGREDDLPLAGCSALVLAPSSTWREERRRRSGGWDAKARRDRWSG